MLEFKGATGIKWTDAVLKPTVFVIHISALLPIVFMPFIGVKNVVIIVGVWAATDLLLMFYGMQLLNAIKRLRLSARAGIRKLRSARHSQKLRRGFRK